MTTAATTTASYKIAELWRAATDYAAALDSLTDSLAARRIALITGTPADEHPTVLMARAGAVRATEQTMNTAYHACVDAGVSPELMQALMSNPGAWIRHEATNPTTEGA